MDEIWDKRAEIKLELAPRDLIAAHWAWDAAVQALEWSIAIPQYSEFSENDTDEDWLDPTGDAAMYAAAAEAGANFDDLYESEKAKTFWEWWLTEAIPQAWELASTSVKLAN